MPTPNNKIIAKLYVSVLIPWEKHIKYLEPKGIFDIRSKEFLKFKRAASLAIRSVDNSTGAHETILAHLTSQLPPQNIVIVLKGDLSIARCIFRHLRNSIAHGNIEAIKIKNNNYLKFIDINPRNENHNFIMILRARNLEHFISALMTTIKESPLAFIDAT